MDESNKPEQKAPEEPKYITADELTALLRAREEKLLAKVAAENGKVVSKLDELVKAKDAPPAQGTEAPQKPQKIEETTEYKSLLRRMAEMEARYKAAEETAAAEKARARESQMRNKLAESLSAAGVDARTVKHAVGYLVDVEKRVRATENGEIIFADGGEEVDLATGLRAWLKTEDAKVYLAPRGAQGSGERPPAKQMPRQPLSTAPSREELAMHLQAALTSGTVNVG